MSEARNVIILILVLLFIFVGVGVAISRLNKNEKATNVKSPGFLSRIFSDLADPVATRSATSTNNSTPTPRPTSDTPLSFTQPTRIPTTSVEPTHTVVQGEMPTSKGGNAEQIPATGAPTWILFVALGGLISGVRLYRKA